MKPTNQAIKEKLLAKGVAMPHPDTVYVAEDVHPDRISGEGVTIYSGSRILGKNTLILPGTKIGYEAPVTMENCFAGKDVLLNGGFFQGAVFLGGNVFGSNAHVRSGTILEEQAGAAHTVGLKQTILFPFVILGSLINFCDCLMAGGTSRKDHSEVGSSFVHFNYTPNQDKATASMMGNVHQGVMLDQPPIFLGGQGGIVGPVRIGFGCLTGAGTIVRKDEERADRMILAGGTKSVSLPRRPGLHSGAVRIFNHNVRYIAALTALGAWYMHVRPIFAKDDLSKKLITALQKTLAGCIRERIRQLEKFCDALGSSPACDHVVAGMLTAKKHFDTDPGQGILNRNGETFVARMADLSAENSTGYIRCIQGLAPENKAMGSEWLLGIETGMSDQLQI